LEGFNLDRSLGALYADEILTSAWFPIYHEGLKNFNDRVKGKLNLEFFDSHANEIEPAHVNHALHLLEFCQENQFDQSQFTKGYNDFKNYLCTKFTGLYAEINR
jgi:pyrroloquinoline quinone (PQQ) biosynthesis protein C